MPSNGGIAAECLLTLLDRREPDSPKQAAQLYLGAELMLDGIYSVKAIAKWLSQLGK